MIHIWLVKVDWLDKEDQSPKYETAMKLISYGVQQLRHGFGCYKVDMHEQRTWHSFHRRRITKMDNLIEESRLPLMLTTISTSLRAFATSSLATPLGGVSLKPLLNKRPFSIKNPDDFFWILVASVRLFGITMLKKVNIWLSPIFGLLNK